MRSRSTDRRAVSTDRGVRSIRLRPVAALRRRVFSALPRRRRRAWTCRGDPVRRRSIRHSHRPTRSAFRHRAARCSHREAQGRPARRPSRRVRLGLRRGNADAPSPLGCGVRSGPGRTRRNADGGFGRASEIAELFRAAGLVDVEETAITGSVTYLDYDELWSGFLAGIGPATAYCTSLTDAQRASLRAELFTRIGSPNAEFSLQAAARCAKATVPD